MKKPMLSLTFATAAVLFATTPITTAAAAPKRAFFAATVKGVQTTEWTIHRQEPPGPCSLGYDGSGAERVEFASAHPVRVEAWNAGPFVILEGVPDGPASMPVRAHIRRRGHFKEWSNSSGPCGTGGNGAPPPPKPTPSDCGSRTSLWTLDLEAPLGSSGVKLTSGEPTPLPVYKNCPVGDFAFPELMDLNRYGRDITAKLPESDVYDASHGTIVLVGHGTSHTSITDQKSYNTIEWTVILRRVS